LQQSIFSVFAEVSLLQEFFSELLAHAKVSVGIKKKPSMTITKM